MTTTWTATTPTATIHNLPGTLAQVAAQVENMIRDEDTYTVRRNGFEITATQYDGTRRVATLTPAA